MIGEELARLSIETSKRVIYVFYFSNPFGRRIFDDFRIAVQSVDTEFLYAGVFQYLAVCFLCLTNHLVPFEQLCDKMPTVSDS